MPVPPCVPSPGAHPLHLPVDFPVDLVLEELHVLLLLTGEEKEHLPDGLLLGRLRILGVVADGRLLAIQRHPHHVQGVERHRSLRIGGGALRAVYRRSAKSLSIRPRWTTSSAWSSARSPL